MEFPVDTRKIDFVHKEMIEKIRSEHGHILSSHAFASLYLWQHAMGLSLICNEDFFAVHCGGRASNTWFFPCGDERKTHDFIVGRMSEKPFSLRYLRECDVRWLEDNFPGKWRFGRDESSDEYICDISEYISLAGSKFSEIRRKIRKIDREHSITVKEISDSTLHDAMRVAKRWYATEHHIGADGLSDDMIAEIALGERAGLNINGVVVYADGAPVSLFAGFPLTADTVDVLIGKCAPNAPRGMAYYALREYLRSLNGTYTFCNHEEDLGIEGIRQMKSSLCPIEKTHVWEADLK